MKARFLEKTEPIGIGELRKGQTFIFPDRRPVYMVMSEPSSDPCGIVKYICIGNENKKTKVSNKYKAYGDEPVIEKEFELVEVE